MSFGEMLILGVIAVVVVGPRNLPAFLRNAGQLIGKVRRMANDIRTESGIDEILEVEGIRSEIDNFRRLASGQITLEDPSPNVVPDREREYPRAGPDAYGAVSEDIEPYIEPPAPALLPPSSTVPASSSAVASAVMPPAPISANGAGIKT